MNALLPYMIADAGLVVAIAFLSARRITFFHPLTFYLFFHAFAFSLRAFELYTGKYPMYFGMNTYAYYSAVTVDEFVRGLIVADVALLLFAIGCFAAGATPTRPRVVQPFNDRMLRVVLFALLPISFGLLAYRRFGSGEAQDVLGEYDLIPIIGGVWRSP
jgi:quinol-cytochrome oxidoreductase complex cytochrome b subunit